jgi:pimeloyl-ACP methyl ester carboxylesterase
MPQAAANGITIEWDSFGGETAEPLLLIMGLGAQMTRWAPEFCQTIADRGFRVIRFDNRDVGLSTHLDDAPIPNLADITEAHRRREKPNVPYTLFDMADDAAGLLTALGAERAHIVGASLGGMVAQLVASEHPHRTLSLVSIMSNTGNPHSPRATPEAMAVLTGRPPNPFKDEEGYLAHTVASARVTGSPAYPIPEAVLRAQAIETYKRAYYPPGFARQFAAANASGDRRESLKKVVAPTLVIHGVDDPLVPLAGGEDTAANIKNARLKVIPGMGHDVPPQLYAEIADAIAENAKRARQPA